MRRIVKTSLDGVYCDEFHADGDPIIPDGGAEIIIPTDGDRFIPATMTGIEVDRNKRPAVLRIICCSPSDSRRWPK